MIMIVYNYIAMLASLKQRESTVRREWISLGRKVICQGLNSEFYQDKQNVSTWEQD